MQRIAVVSWAPGGNLPPLLAAARLLAERGQSVSLLASGATRRDAAALGLDVHTYARAADPDTAVAFEHQAEAMLAHAAGAELARDVRDLLREIGAALAIVDCMLPAGIAGGRSGRSTLRVAGALRLRPCPPGDRRG